MELELNPEAQIFLFDIGTPTLIINVTEKTEENPRASTGTKNKLAAQNLPDISYKAIKEWKGFFASLSKQRICLE